jgi:hypothetical protein
MQAHEIALRIGLETQDEGRAIEDRPPLTEAERQQWLDAFGPHETKRDVAETIQKVYLGVGKVITADEARQIANEAGANLVIPGPIDESAGAQTVPPAASGSA